MAWRPRAAMTEWPRTGDRTAQCGWSATMSGGAFGDPARAYDSFAGGGCTTLEVSPHAESVSSWVSINGTNVNCAGGPSPWGSWITCEENILGPDVAGATGYTQ